MSALALTLAASAARRSSSEIIRSRLGEALKMKDPVMAADGYTYERVAIEQWLATGAGTSPKTNELLENEKLLPNKALKALIVGELERRARGRA